MHFEQCGCWSAQSNQGVRLASYKAGKLDEKSWHSYMAPVASMFATEPAKSVLNLYTGSPEFARVLADKLRAAKDKAA